MKSQARQTLPASNAASNRPGPCCRTSAPPRPCMPGAQITEQIDDTHFKGIVKSKIGPAMMSFNGDIELQGLDPATRMLKMMGKGADKAGSSAQMTLEARVEPEGSGAALVGQASFVVAGKLARLAAGCWCRCPTRCWRSSPTTSAPPLPPVVPAFRPPARPAPVAARPRCAR